MVVEKPLLLPCRQLFPSLALSCSNNVQGENFLLPALLQLLPVSLLHHGKVVFRACVFVCCCCSYFLTMLLLLLSLTYFFLTNFSGFLSGSEPDRTIASHPRHAYLCFLFTILCAATRKLGGGVMG